MITNIASTIMVVGFGIVALGIMINCIVFIWQ